ncbi:MAG: 4-(cytidine 5'-diphospho)-2-C-methyl-D-erythritol kinase [Deltaproteobacteria bacterium]
MRSITLLSPAKINLTLEVLGQRPDGYHEIRSLMQPVDLFDEVRVETIDTPGIEFTSSGIEIPSGAYNLASRAAEIYLKKAGLKSGVKIHIKKKIPTGAGLGGGSGNAAAVLTGMNRIFNALTEEDLFLLSPGLGADVAFFIRSATALVHGIGERITVLRDFPLFCYVVLCPNLEIATADIYRKWDELNKDTVMETGDGRDIAEDIERFKSGDGDFPLMNDLELPASALHPEIKAYKEILFSLGAKNVLMTGSGSAVFAVFGDEDEALQIYDYLKTTPTFRVYFTRGIKGWHRII